METKTETEAPTKPMEELQEYYQIDAELTIPIAPFANIRPKIQISVPTGLKDKELVQWICNEYGNFVNIKLEGTNKKK